MKKGEPGEIEWNRGNSSGVEENRGYLREINGSGQSLRDRLDTRCIR